MSDALEVLAYAADGTRRPRAVRLPADPFDGTVNQAALHRAVTVFLANQRQGTTETKTRSFVTGGNQKPWRQKGTGRARQGSIRSPLWPGGGTMFGPHPREYRLQINRKVKRLARASAFNARAREHAIRVIEPLTFEAPKTRRVAELLGRLGIADQRVLMLTEALNQNLILSARNLQNVQVMRYRDASTYDILRAEALLIEEPAFGAALEPGGDAAAIAPPESAPKAKRAQAKAEGEGEGKRKPARKAASAPRAKSAAKPAAPKPRKPEPRAEAKKPAAKKAEPAKAEKKPEARKPEAKKGKTGKKPGKKE